MRIVSGIHKRAVRAAIWTRIVYLGCMRAGGPARAARSIRTMVHRRSDIRDGRTTQKYAKAAGRYFWDLYSPGFPSRSFDRYVVDEIRHAALSIDGAVAPEPLQSVIVAITKKCPLRCEHCCEWDVLNQPENLSRDDLAAIVARFQRHGVAQILFSGGEPLQRFDDLIAVLRSAAAGTDFWIFTSGVGLTDEKARELKDAGLTGVLVSVDHWDPDAHNAFRGVTKTFEWVRRAAAAVARADLALGLSLCPTRGFTSAENLERYGALSRELGAGFVQFLEPRAVGHYAGHDVALAPAQVAALEDYLLAANYGAAAGAMPIVAYPAYTQRRVGCFGSGRRYLYVDTDGLVHPCPFCRHAVAHALDDDFERVLSAVRSAGCAAFTAPAVGTSAAMVTIQ